MSLQVYYYVPVDTDTGVSTGVLLHTCKEERDGGEDDGLGLTELQLLDVSGHCEQGVDELYTVHRAQFLHIHCLTPEERDQPVLMVECFVSHDQKHLMA